MRIIKNFAMYSLLLLTLFTSCSIDEQPNENDYLRTFEDVKVIVENFQYSESSASRTNGYSVLSQKNLADKDGTNAILILNQLIDGEKWFSVLSLDTRTLPMLAFGKGEFITVDISPETKFWLDGQMKLIESVRFENITIEEFSRRVNKENDDGNGNGPGPCSAGTEWNGPLLDHTWAQGCVYNANCPVLGCTVGNCDATQALVGCVATAITQVLGYHEQPTNYPWAMMLNRYGVFDFNEPGAVELAEAMALAGDAVNMDYGCDASGVTLSAYASAVDNAFDNVFGYTSSGDYYENTDVSAWNDYTPVRGSVGAERPVILARFSILGGHAWVCDGTRRTWDCETSTYFYHMNWGWNGFNNGWFVGYGLFPEETNRITHITP